MATRKRFSNHVTIASIYPLATSKQGRPFGQDLDSAYSEYQIPACPKGEVKYLQVFDAEERSQNWAQGGEWDRKPVMCEAIAADLITHWCSGFMAQRDGLGPGIMVIAGDEITPEELNELKMKQTRWAEILFYNANELAADDKNAHITTLHREMTRYIGRNAEWVTSDVTIPDEIIDCPICTRKIKAAAYVCPECKIQLRPLPKKYAEMEGKVAESMPLAPPVNAPKPQARQ